MVERFNVVSISLFKCACCHAYSHAFFMERACFLVPTSAWVYDLALWLAFSIIMRALCLEIIDLTLFMQL